MPYPWEQLPPGGGQQLADLAIPPPSITNPGAPWAPPRSFTIYGPYQPPEQPLPPLLPPPEVSPPSSPPPISEPPPAQPPPSEPFTPVGPPASAGTSDESYRDIVQRAIDDTEVRRNAGPPPGPAVIEGQFDERPPWWAGPVARRVGRAILGPYGAIAGQVIEVLGPEVLGRGEPPLRGIAGPTIPAPSVSFPEPQFGFPEPPAPELTPPPVPDVVVVTPEDSWPAPAVPSATRSTTPAPTSPTTTTGLPNWTKIIGAAAAARAARWALRPSKAPIPRGLIGSEAGLGDATRAPPTTATDPLTPPWPTAGTDPLTPPRTGLLPSPLANVAPAGAGLIPSQPATTEEDRCRCREKKPKKRKKSPSSTIAHIDPFNRRMSTYSLKNLRRGSKVEKALKRFL